MENEDVEDLGGVDDDIDVKNVYAEDVYLVNNDDDVTVAVEDVNVEHVDYKEVAVVDSVDVYDADVEDVD